MIAVNYRVIYGDTDCGGVMYYGTYLRLFEIGRTEFLRAKGLSYREIEEKRGIILPVVEVWAKYRASAKYDDLLTIKTYLKEAKSYKITFFYEIYRSEELLAEGKTSHVAISKEGKILRIPKDILDLLSL